MRPRPLIPTAINTDPADSVTITWRDGRIDRHRARDLRLTCPCARCVHEITGTPLLDPASVSADLRVSGVQQAGNYAYQFTWSDGHATGLYTFAWLRARGDAQARSP